MNNIIEEENKIKDQLYYIENNKERSEMKKFNADPLRVCVKNEELFYRALNK